MRNMRFTAALRPQSTLLIPMPRRGRLAGWTALLLVAAELGGMFFGATLPTPLYPLYRTSFGFGTVTLTLIYAVYVLGNLAALLFFGRLSDQLGRRPATFLAIACGAASTLVFIFAGGTGSLFVARILSGLATGIAAGTATAWITELEPRHDKATSAIIASAANFAGLAVAPLFAGALLAVAPWPLRLPYVVYLALLAGLAAVVLLPAETVKNRATHLSDLSLRLRLGVPREILRAFLPPAVAAFVTFALLGFYAALIPSVVRDSLHLTSPLIAGGVVFELFLIAAAAAVVTGRWESGAAMRAGLVLLLPSLALLVAAQLTGALSLLLVATALGGGAAALGYRGSLEEVNRIAPGERRAEVVSSYLIAVYLGNSLPVIGIGLLTDLAGTTTAHLAFAGVIGLLAGGALAATAKWRRDA